MSTPSARRSDDESVVEAQLDRPPRGKWRVAVRCSLGYPSVVLTEPLLDDGTPFPTLYWLTCPWLIESVGRIEGDGGAAHWAGRLAMEKDLASRAMEADAEYRKRRSAETEAEDPCVTVGVAGQSDPLATKCLHAHVAAYLAGTGDPVGAGVLEQTAIECDDATCDSLAPDASSQGGSIDGSTK